MQKRYLVYLDNRRSYSAENSKGLLQTLRLTLKTHTNEEIRDIRISEYFIELDIGSDHKTIFFENDEKFVSSIRNIGSILFVEELSEKRHKASDEETITSAICLFNLQRFWKSHEVLEGVWRNAYGYTKRILNGLILIDAAYVHLQKGEYDIYISILKRSVEKLEDSPDYFFNINMIKLMYNLEKIISENCAFYFKIFLK